MTNAAAPPEGVPSARLTNPHQGNQALARRGIGAKLATAAIVLLAGCSSGPEDLPAVETEIREGSATAIVAEQPLPALPDNVILPSGAEDVIFFPGAANVTTQEARPTTWAETYVKATAPGFHFNINQAARLADSSATTWAPVFSYPIPIDAGQVLYFCGPTPTVGVQVYAVDVDALLFNDTLEDVPPCA